MSSFFSRMRDRARGDGPLAVAPRVDAWYAGGGFLAPEIVDEREAAPPVAARSVATPAPGRAPTAPTVPPPARAVVPATIRRDVAAPGVPPVVAAEREARPAVVVPTVERRATTPLVQQVATTREASVPGVRPQSERAERAEAGDAPSPRHDRFEATPPPQVERAREIHVHIGRVEVRAMLPAAPPAPAPVRRDPPAAMSLDRFLSRGRERR